MGNKDAGHAFLGQFLDGDQHFLDRFRVKCLSDLVKKHHIGIHGQRTGNVDIAGQHFSGSVFQKAAFDPSGKKMKIFQNEYSWVYKIISYNPRIMVLSAVSFKVMVAIVMAGLDLV